MARVHQAFGRASGESRRRGGSRRTASPRGARLHRRGPVRGDGHADGDRGLAADRLRPTGRLRYRGGRAAGGPAVASLPHRAGLHLEPNRARRLDCGRYPDILDGLGPHQPVPGHRCRGERSPRRPRLWRSLAGGSSTRRSSISSASHWRCRPSAAATPWRAPRTSCGRLACRPCSARASSSRCSRASPPCRARFCSCCSCRPPISALWTNAPLAGLAQHLAGPAWARDLVAVALVGAAALLLVPAAHLALGDAEQLLQRLSVEGAAVGAPGLPAHEVRHAVARHRRRGCRDDPRDVRQRRTRQLAGARLCDGDRGDARAQDRGARPAAAAAAGGTAVPGAVQPARGHARDPARALRRPHCSSALERSRWSSPAIPRPSRRSR